MQPMLARRILNSSLSSSSTCETDKKTAPIPIPARKPGRPPLTRIEEIFHNNNNNNNNNKNNNRKKTAPRPTPNPTPTPHKSLPAPPTLTPIHARRHACHCLCPLKQRALRRKDEFRLVVLAGAAQWITYAINPARGPEAREMLAEVAGKHDEAFRAFKEEIERTKGWVELPEEMKGDGVREETGEKEEVAGTMEGEVVEEEVVREAMVECECGREEAEARVKCGRGCLL